MFSYILPSIFRELKTVGESLEVSKVIEDIITKTKAMGNTMAGSKLQSLQLAEALNGYSIGAIKASISESTLNEMQIRTILSQKGLTGNILETTTAELTAITTTNAMTVSEGAATTATVGLGTAIKGLGVTLKTFVTSHPYLIAIAAAIGAIYAAVKIVDACTTTFDELKDKISDLKQEVSDSESTLKDYKTQLNEINQKITEINSQDSLSFTDEQELKNLESQRTELENMYNIEKARHDLKQKELEATANEYFDKKITPSLSKEYKDYSVLDENGIEKSLTKLDIMNQAKERMLLNQSRLDTLNEEYNNKSNPSNKETKEYKKRKKELEKARDDAKKTALDIQEEAKNQIEGLDSTSDTYKKVTEASQELSDALARLNNDWDSLSSKGKQEDLSSKISKEAKNLTSDDMKNIDNYLSTLSDDDLTILANVTFDENTTLESLKETIKAAQEEANKSSIDLSVKTFDPTSLLEESDDKTKTATLADLQSEADLLSSIQKELSETGRIGVDSMQKIIKQYPEAKDALGQYMLGIISQEELFAELEGVYEDDKDAYIKSVIEKAKTDEDFFNTLKTNYPELINQLGAVYGTDVANWTTMEQAKVNITAQAIQQIANIYKEFYKAMGVNDGIDFNIQATKNAISAGNPGAIGGSLFSKSYSKSNFDKVVTDNNHKFKMNGNDVSNAYKELQNNIDSVWNTAEKMKNAIDDAAYNQINASIDTSWQGLGGSDSSSSSQTAEKLNWIERLINKISTAYSRLKNIVSDTTTTWLNRNNALADSMSVLRDEINAQSQAYEYYMNAFNSYGLDDYYKNQIADGSISIDVIYDDDLKDAISDCQDFYDKAQDAKTAVQELNIELKGLAKSRFDNVASEFEEKINKIVAVRDLYSKEDELMNEKGWFSSTLLNSAMIDQENKNLQKLEAERDALVNALNSAVNSGSIMPESEDWYSMQSAIDEVSSSILDAKKALVEYDNTIRQINWDAFDRTRDDVENLITETDFLTELLKDVGITDDNGNMTKEGQAAQALLAQKYQLYLNQAKAYKDEIAKIDADLANNPYDKELLDRKQDLIDKEQEAIKSAMSEKDAIKDLTNDAYSDFIDKLGDAIDKYKELMSTMKDAYDYEKSIREKTEALNVLEKQYSAYQGDNSEEGKKNIQQLKDQINSAKDDLKDTEYEKLISDTEKILDQLKDNTQEWLNQRLDQLDNLIQDIIDQSNDNASDIAETITSTAENYGYKLSESMASIWSTNTGNITKVLDNFSTSFIDSNSKIKDVCDNINSAVQGLLANSNAEAQRVADEIARQQAEQNASSDGGYSGGNDYSDDDWSGNWDTGSDDNDSSGSDGVDWIYSKDYFDKNSLNIDTSIVDRLKLHDYDSSFAARSQYYDQMGGEGQYYATYDQNVWMLDWMKSHGYRKGTKSAISGLHIYGEDDPGSEVLVTKYGVLRQFDSGDTVFNKDQVEKLWNLSKGITTPNMYMDNLGAKLPDISNMSNNLSNKVDVQFGDVTLSLPNVRNYEDFMKEAQKDPKFEKMIQNMTLGQTLGRNSLNKLTFR
jgi:DNA repair exonuclease SbcCD ATPase subunit